MTQVYDVVFNSGFMNSGENNVNEGLYMSLDDALKHISERGYTKEVEYQGIGMLYEKPEQDYSQDDSFYYIWERNLS